MSRQHLVHHPLGNVLSAQSNHLGASIETENAQVEIYYYRENLVRVRVRRKDQAWEPHSYAVIAEPELIMVGFEGDEDMIRLSSPQAIVEVEREPFRLIFKDGGGNLLNEDDPFSTSWQGEQVYTYKKLQEGERFIGLGEKSGPLDRRGNAYENWNTDAFGYGPDDDPLYLTTPFYMGLHQGRSYGLFFDNSHKTTFSFGASNRRFSWFSGDAGEMDYYLFSGTVAEIIQSYSWLTGYMPLPPRWSLGYQQCRYSYYPEAEVRTLARTFREKQIPCDVIYLDIHYMDGYRVFTFHPDRFPDPEGLIADMKNDGFQLAIIQDPGIRVDDDYPAYRRCIEGKHVVTFPDGSPYEGEVWPGWSVFPDFTDGAARDWWKEETKYYTQMGLSALWNDMNEPTAWGHMLPNNIQFSWEGTGASHLQARNVYGMQMARATREAADEQLPKRPFILTRAGYSGIQRYATVWTGDNVASDDHMLAGVRLLSSMGLTGMPFTGYDVGAFVGECSPNLFARWIQLGTFSPFFRGHSMVNSRDSEPWSYGEQYEEISRNYIGLRYQLLPYIMGAMFTAHQTGMPLVRSLAIDFTWDDQIYNPAYHNQYLFGPSLLVVPVESDRDLKKAYLPAGNWYDLFTDQQYSGSQEAILETEIDKLPVFARGGTALAMQSLVQHTAEAGDGILYLHLYAGDLSRFQTDLYEDQDQHHPEEDRQYWRRNLVFESTKGEMVLHSNEGEWEGPYREIKVFFHGFNDLETVQVNGSEQSLTDEAIRFIQPISKFDPFGPEKGRVLEAHCKSIQAPLNGSEMSFKVNW